MSQIQFIIGNKLPTTYDVALSIYSVSTQPTSNKMATAIHEYSMKLIDTWEKLFGSKHVISITGVKYKLKKVTKEYHNQVYDKAHRKTKKKKSEEERMILQSESKESR